MGKLLKNGSPARKNKLTTAVGSSGKKTIKTKASSSQGSATPKLNMGYVLKKGKPVPTTLKPPTPVINLGYVKGGKVARKPLGQPRRL